MNILAIGNSFSQDATRYLHEIMQAGGVPGRVVNLYIGGCSLERHWRNIENEAKDYEYQLNGRATGQVPWLFICPHWFTKRHISNFDYTQQDIRLQEQ